MSFNIIMTDNSKHIQKDESLVSFKTALLAKENGYNEPSVYLYSKRKSKDTGSIEWDGEYPVHKIDWNNNFPEQHTAARIGDLREWLFKTHNIFVSAKISSIPSLHPNIMIQPQLSVQYIDGGVCFDLPTNTDGKNRHYKEVNTVLDKGLFIGLGYIDKIFHFRSINEKEYQNYVKSFALSNKHIQTIHTIRTEGSKLIDVYFIIVG